MMNNDDSSLMTNDDHLDDTGEDFENSYSTKSRSPSLSGNSISEKHLSLKINSVEPLDMPEPPDVRQNTEMSDKSRVNKYANVTL